MRLPPGTLFDCADFVVDPGGGDAHNRRTGLTALEAAGRLGTNGKDGAGVGQRDLGFLLVPIIALLAVFVPSRGSSNRAESPPASSAALETNPAASDVSRRDAAALLQEYGSIPSSSGPALTGSSLKAEACLIATLPDPVDAANLNYTYDRYLDAIQRAMEGAGYLLDRFDLPWLDPAGPPAAANAVEPRFRREPGRLLFRSRIRGDDPLPPPAFVFIVGETPTAGIHKAAFVHAVQELSAVCANGESEPIRILGPSFSGSATSLHALMRAFAAREFVIVSGSATAIDSAELTRGVNAVFQTTIAQDIDARNRLLAFIAQREERRPYNRLRRLWSNSGEAAPQIKVALLVESNTAFGSVVAQGPAQLRAAPRDHGPDAVEPIAEVIPSSIDLVRLPFPLHIASLRVAARDSGGPAPAPQSSGTAPSLTKLNLRNAPAARTVVPLLSQNEPSSIEIVLSKLLETLEEEHVRYIGLVATDIEDRVFLSQQIRHHLPNTVLFMFSTDLLYLHPDINVDLRGAQIVTSYPLFSENVEWTPAAAESPRLLFPTHTTQGVYNAALVLLGLDARMQEYGYPFDSTRDSPLWLSMIGADGIWPIRLLGQADTRDMVSRAPRTSRPSAVSMPNHPWFPTMTVVACFVPAFFFIANFAPRLGRRLFRSAFRTGPVAQVFSDTIYRAHRLPRRLYLLACWAALTSTYLLTATIFTLPALTAWAFPILQWQPSIPATFFNLVLLGGVLLTSGAFVFAVVLVLEGAGHDQVRKHLRWFARIGVAFISFGLVVHTAWLCRRWLGLALHEPADSVMLYMRSADLGSGASPLLPLVLLCTAAVAWAMSALRRLRLIEGPNQYGYAVPPPGSRDQRRRTKLPHSFLGFEGASFEGVTALEQSLMNAVGRRSTELPRTLLVTLLVFLALAWGRLFGPRSAPTPEGTAFDTLFAVGFLAIYAGLAMSFVRFVYVWRKLLQLLRRLAWHPTVKAYARLREKIPGKPKINLTSPSQIFTALEFSIDRAGQLVALARDLIKSGTAERRFTLALQASFPELEYQVTRAEAALHAALNAETQGDWRRTVRERTRAERRLSLVARTVTTLLRPAWRLPATDAPSRGKEKPDELDWFALGEDFLTSRVAAFLSHVVPQLQNLVIFVTAGLLLMLLAVTAYPFEPKQLLLFFNTTVILVVVSTTLVVFVQMERETILSVLSDSEPGQISWNRDFVSRVAVYVILPIISLLGAQFPEVAQQLFSWTSSFFGTH